MKNLFLILGWLVIISCNDHCYEIIHKSKRLGVFERYNSDLRITQRTNFLQDTAFINRVLKERYHSTPEISIVDTFFQGNIVNREALYLANVSLSDSLHWLLLSSPIALWGDSTVGEIGYDEYAVMPLSNRYVYHYPFNVWGRLTLSNNLYYVEKDSSLNAKMNCYYWPGCSAHKIVSKRMRNLFLKYGLAPRIYLDFFKIVLYPEFGPLKFKYYDQDGKTGKMTFQTSDGSASYQIKFNHYIPYCFALTQIEDE